MTDLPPPVPAAERLSLSEATAPPGFTFPGSFCTLIVREELPDLSPAYFLAQYDSDAIGDWTRILAQQFPERVLVPFAKDDGSDDVYCFDGKDLSGDPAVLLIHSFTTPGWEYRGEWFGFDSWLTATTEMHEEWRQSRPSPPPTSDEGSDE